MLSNTTYRRRTRFVHANGGPSIDILVLDTKTNHSSNLTTFQISFLVLLIFSFTEFLKTCQLGLFSIFSWIRFRRIYETFTRNTLLEVQIQIRAGHTSSPVYPNTSGYTADELQPVQIFRVKNLIFLTAKRKKTYTCPNHMTLF